MTDLSQWLERLGLAQYASTFADNDVDFDVLPELSDEELKELGVSLGHRKKLLKAVRALGPRSRQEDSATPARTPSASSGAERRQLTVFFCDLVGSVELGEQMDVEDYRNFLAQFRNVVVDAIQRSSGFVARHQGDGILAYFGYPQAHEDDAERAVKCGLEVVDAIKPMGAEVRVGIATGPAVVGDVLATGASERSELAALGPTPNLAARLQSAAAAGTVVISRTTHDLVGGFFSTEALAPRVLKGLGETLLYQVLAERASRTRFEAKTEGGRLSPFLGRDEEFETLERRWHRACRGDGQVVLALGEAGIGKSRLAQQLRLEAAKRHADVALLQCSPLLVNSAFHPFAPWLEQTALSAGPALADERLRAWLAKRALSSDEAIGLLATLASTPLSVSTVKLKALEPNERRERLLTLLVNCLTHGPTSSPALCVFEDIHWADPSTLELLGRMVEVVPRRRVMVLATTRPGFSASWFDLPHVHVMTLSRLEEAVCESLAQAVAGPGGLSGTLVSEIVNRAGGNPLFVEELTRSALESEEPSARGLAIPATLQDSLAARLDGLPTGKRVAQCASVIGRNFTLSLLGKVWDETPASLTRGLQELAQAGLVYRRGGQGEEHYQFKHSLVEQTAYGTLLRETRQELHARIATSLESEAPSEDPVLVAHHYSAAGLAADAIRFWLAAGQKARSSSNNIEAVSHFRAGVESLSGMASPERERAEILLQSSLGQALLVTEGYADSAPRQALERARELCRETGDDAHLPTVLQGLWRCNMAIPNFAAGNEVAQELISVARHQRDGSATIVGHHFLGASLLWNGDLEASLEHSERSIELYDSERGPESLFRVGTHPKGNALANAAWALWLLGRPDRALQYSRSAVAFAETTGQPLSMANALVFASILGVLRRNEAAAMRHATRAAELCEEKGIRQYGPVATALRGWGLCRLGQSSTGLRIVENSLRELRESGMGLFWPFLSSLLTRGYQQVGRLDDAVAATEEALSVVVTNQERWIEPELLRLRGECALLQPRVNDATGARGYFERALSSARGHRAKSWELRAAMSLAASFPDDGMGVLESVYGAFVEGFTTPDLLDAKGLLERAR